MNIRWSGSPLTGLIVACWMLGCGGRSSSPRGPGVSAGPPAIAGDDAVPHPATAGDGAPVIAVMSDGAIAVPSDGSSAVTDAAVADVAPREAASAIPITGLGPWTGHDDVPPSQSPPGDLDPARVPLFVSLGFDDNPEREGVSWAVSAISALKNPPGTGKAATYDGTPARGTFYHSSVYATAAASWKAAYAAGFETGDHTIHHFHGASDDSGMNFTQGGWTTEIQGCIDFLTGPVGVKRDDIFGFRTPYLQYNANVFPALAALKFWYDCSIQEGIEPGHDGTNFLWPYTLDHGSPGHAAHPKLTPIATWPKGLWEMPAYRVIVPPDGEASKYGIPPGLRAKLAKVHPDYFTEAAGQITGLDWNLWYDFGLSKAEFVATLEHTLDLRRRGNRAPLLFGMHSAIYTNQTEPVPAATLAERRQAIVDVLTYALQFPEVRVVTTKSALDWIRNPVPLD
jgi:hypothetical protein